jgi:hypothetical protein
MDLSLRAVARAFAAAGTASVLASCSASAADMEDAAKDEPGVVEVHAEEVEGDDSLPFEAIPKDVSLVMAEDATAEQVIDAVDDYADRDIGLLRLVLEGPKRARLDAGGMRPTDDMVRDLVEAQHDDTVAGYLADAVEGGGVSAQVFLFARDRDSAVAAADRYLDEHEVSSVTVVAGRFSVTRDRSA